MFDAYRNPAVRRDDGYRGLFAEAEYRSVAAFYDRQPHLAPTPLVSLSHLAIHLSLGDILIKDETRRFGLEAFKVAGALYAMETLGAAALSNGVVCATAGNHGRAVAHAARKLGATCTVFVPAVHERAADVERRTRASRITGMREDGAATIDVEESYEQAVERAAEHARRTGAAVVSDTSWDGYETVPRLIMAGYTRIFAEAARQWRAPPDIVLVQGGVGGLVCAAANWFARHVNPRPYLIACEPESAACLLASARQGRIVHLDQAGAPGAPTMMAGLRCATPSPAAWPSIAAGVDAFVAIPDAIAADALDRLAQPLSGDPPIPAGPSGACGVGALLALLSAPELAPIREASALDRSTRVMAIVTEGP